MGPGLLYSLIRLQGSKVNGAPDGSACFVVGYGIWGPDIFVNGRFLPIGEGSGFLLLLNVRPVAPESVSVGAGYTCRVRDCFALVGFVQFGQFCVGVAYAYGLQTGQTD